jgi:cell division protein FtsQ
MSAKVTDATSRLKLREGERRRGLAIRVLVWTLSAILAGGLVYVIGFSPVFATGTIAISGVQVLTKQDVLAAAGVSVGTPLATVDTNRVADRVAGLPAVAEVTVARGWPDTLRITIVERRPRLAIPADGGYLLADASGVVFQTVAELPAGLALVVAPTTDRQLLVDVGTVFSALSADTAAKVVRLEAPTRDGIELRLRDGSRVVWGSADQSELKSQVLDGMLPKGGRVFDVSAPGFPARR